MELKGQLGYVDICLCECVCIERLGVYMYIYTHMYEREEIWISKLTHTWSIAETHKRRPEVFKPMMVVRGCVRTLYQSQT